MIINSSNLSTLRQGLQLRFENGLKSAPPLDISKIATVVPSGTAIENYPMGAFLDTIRKWVGPRQLGAFLARNLQVTNDDYEATIGIPANAIADDMVGIYGNVAEGKGKQCQALWIKLVFDALAANGNWLDSSAFFYASRTFGSSTINNYTTSALTEDNFDTAYQAMISFTGYDGEPLGIIPDLLVVGPALRKTAFDILKGQNKIVHGGKGSVSVPVDNPNKGVCDFMVSPYLVGTRANYWFLMCTTGVVMPILVQKRKEGPLVALDKPTDPNVFFGTVDGKSAVPGGVYVYGAHYRGAAALSLPHLCYGGLKSA